MRRSVVVGAVVGVVVAVVVVVLELRQNDGAKVEQTAERVSAPAGWQLLSEQDKNDAVLGQSLGSSGCVQSIRTWLADVGAEDFVDQGTAMLAGAGAEVSAGQSCQFRPNVQPAARDCVLTGSTADAEMTLRWRHPEYAQRVVQDQPVEGRALVTLTVEPS